MRRVRDAEFERLAVVDVILPCANVFGGLSEFLVQHRFERQREVRGMQRQVAHAFFLHVRDDALDHASGGT